MIVKNKQYFKFCSYGFLKSLRFFMAFFILFFLQKGLSYTQIGLLYSIREIFINIFEVPSGIFADTYGRKNSLITSFILYIISFYIFYISNTFLPFVLAFILYGVAEAFRSGTHKGMIMDYLRLNGWGDQKIDYYGHTRSWSQKGSAISSLIAGIIVFHSGKYENIFLISIIPYILNLFLILSYPKELNHPIRKDKKSKEGIVSTIKSLFQIIKEPKVLKIINYSALHTAYLKAIKDYIQPLMINIALIIPIMSHTKIDKKSGIVIGILYFFIYLLTSKASLLSSKLAKKKINIPYVTLLLGISLGTISGIFYIYNLWIVSIIAFVGIYIVENIRKPILVGYISDNVPNEILTSVLSVQSLLKTVMTATIASLFGIFSDLFSIGVSFVIISLSLIIISLLLNFYKKEK